MFKKMRGCKLSYNQQGLIRFICLNYYDLPQDVQHKINDLCLKCGGEYYKALFRVLTTDISIRYIALEECISETHLYRMRLKFYNEFFKT